LQLNRRNPLSTSLNARPWHQRTGCEPSAEAASPVHRSPRNWAISRQAQMTKRVSLLAKTLLTLLVLSSCSPQDSPRAEGTGFDNKPSASAGVTIFGDARLGVTFN
jgi:hypothetical protein